MRNLEEFVKTSINVEITECTELHSGLSNATYAVNGEYAVRLKKPSDTKFYSAKTEQKILHEASSNGIAPEVLAFDKEGNCITKWIKNSRAYVEPAMTNEDLISTVETIKKVHNLPRTLRNFSAIRRYKHYKKLSKITCVDKHEDKIVSLANEFFSRDKKVLSHNDIVFGNLIKDTKDNRIYLIDYEFSAMNHPFFDLASLISENLLESKEQFELILQTYLGRAATTEERVKLLVIIAFENYLWYYWAVSRFIATGNEEFNTIARIKKDEVIKTSSYMWKKGII